jgi:pimeloyl-ACP methyl ester carboxylesterase
MVRLIDYARIADKIYVPSTDEHPSVPGWVTSRIRKQDADQSARDPWNEGLQCRCFRRKHGGTDVVIAFRGTACGADLGADAKLAFWGIPMRCHEAIRLTQVWQSHYAGYRVTLTGHSLGGAIAQVVGARTGIRFVTFNAPGMLANTSGMCANPFTKQNAKLGVNYIKIGDTIGNFGRHIGDTRRVSFSSLFNPIPGRAHSMTRFVEFIDGYSERNKDPLA